MELRLPFDQLLCGIHALTVNNLQYPVSALFYKSVSAGGANFSAIQGG
jgi:hypothetical protein